MWEAICLMDTLGEFELFQNAFKAIYDRLKSEVFSEEVMNDSTWIISTGANAHPIYFWDAKDIMCNMGYLVNGKWIDKEF